jgi:hypothetical protein
MRKSCARSMCAVCFCMTCLAWSQTHAASYEVVPTVVETPPYLPASFFATVFDNMMAKIYDCEVSYAAGSNPFNYKCKTRQSTLAPSSDLTAVGQIFQNTPHCAGGIWQINSKTGDLQFCIDQHCWTTGAPNVCIKIDWRKVSP